MPYNEKMNSTWTIKISGKAAKQINLLNERVKKTLRLLVADLETNGPIPGKRWPNYGKLNGKKSEDNRHCHLIKGNPTYVCCWRVYKDIKFMEIYYVGTHENAPY